MTKRGLLAILRPWQDSLGLSVWDIDVDFDTPAPENHYAAVLMSSDYDGATILLAPDWRTWTHERAETSLVHELVHLLLRDLDHVLDAVGPHLHPDALAVIRRTHTHFIEQAVERLAKRFIEVAA